MTDQRDRRSRRRQSRAILSAWWLAALLAVAVVVPATAQEPPATEPAAEASVVPAEGDVPPVEVAAEPTAEPPGGLTVFTAQCPTPDAAATTIADPVTLGDPEAIADALLAQECAPVPLAATLSGGSLAAPQPLAIDATGRLTLELAPGAYQLADASGAVVEAFVVATGQGVALVLTELVPVGTVAVIVHRCPEAIQTKDDLAALGAFADRVLACPVVTLPGDEGALNAAETEQTDFDLAVTGADGTVVPLAEAEFAPAVLCEPDLNLDTDESGVLDPATCVEDSRYGFDVRRGPVAVQVAEAPADSFFGDALVDPANDAAAAVVEVTDDLIRLDTTADNAVALHLFYFAVVEDPIETPTVTPTATVEPAPVVVVPPIEEPPAVEEVPAVIDPPVVIDQPEIVDPPLVEDPPIVDVPIVDVPVVDVPVSDFPILDPVVLADGTVVDAAVYDPATYAWDTVEALPASGTGAPVATGGPGVPVTLAWLLSVIGSAGLLHRRVHPR